MAAFVVVWHVASVPTAPLFIGIFIWQVIGKLLHRVINAAPVHQMAFNVRNRYQMALFFKSNSRKRQSVSLNNIFLKYFFKYFNLS